MSFFNPQPLPPSSPPRKRQKTASTPQPYDSENDDGDALFDGIIPDTPRAFETQPTQIIDRSAIPPQQKSSPVAPGSVVQVLASSPFRGRDPSPVSQQPLKRPYVQHNANHSNSPAPPKTSTVLGQPPQSNTVAGASSSSQIQRSLPRSIASSMAPAGTAYRPPNGIVSKPPTSQLIRDLVDDGSGDMNSLFGSSDEDEIPERGSIKPSNLNFTKGAPSSFGSFNSQNPKQQFQAILDKSKYRGPQSQVRPERAQPVGTYPARVLPEEEIRRCVTQIKHVLPHVGYQEARSLVEKYSGNWEQAIEHILNKEKAAADRKAIIDMTKDDFDGPQMKRGIQGPVQSLRDKYSSTQAQPSKTFDLTSDEPKAKRKLVRGRREPSSPVTAPSPVAAPSPAKPKAPIIEIPDDFDTDSGNESVSEDDPEMEIECLNFFNTASLKDLIEMTNTTQAYAEAMINARPFRSLDKARAVENAQPTKSGKKSKRAAIGEKIVNTAMEMMSGYQAVDTLVKKCSEIANPIRTEMATWGVKIHGLTGDGDLELVSFEDDTHDSGIGTPSNRSVSPNDDADGKVVGSVRRRGFNYLKKPELMAEDCVLKDYQVVGLNWLAMMYRQKVSCILADEMGLGKTCQVIAFLSHLVETGHNGPHLVVCPGSTLENWSRELRRFAPNLNIELYYGGQAERAEVGEDIIANRKKINVVVTTYDMAVKPQDLRMLRQLDADVCVYDEGHTLKNPKTKRYESLVKIPANQRLLLTGTPLQNNLQELAALLAFIMPKLFRELKNELDFVFKSKATTKDADHAALLSAQRIERAKSILTPFVLRRKKTQVMKHMPGKTGRVQYCTMHPSQKKIYDEFIEEAKERARMRAEGIKIPTGKGNGKDKENNPMMQLRKAAVHPLLFRRHFTDRKVEEMTDILRRHESHMFPSDKLHRREHLVEEMKLFNDFGLHQWCIEYPSISKYRLQGTPWMDSGKVSALVELVTGYKTNGDRVLIFSQFQMVLDTLEAVLTQSLISFSRIDGDTPIEHRQTLIDNYANDDSITAFLLTTKAGGTGINLAAANKVIIFDMSFNPQDDKQAENRAHRVGQTREVEVVRFVTKDTIEEQIYGLGQSKLKLDGRVAGGDDGGEDEEAGESAIAKSFLAANSGEPCHQVENKPQRKQSKLLAAATSQGE